MSGTPHSLRLAELLCSRMCHDLSGLIGTLGSGLDLTEDPALATEAMALAREAAAELRQRLELQRAAWGATVGPLDLPGLRTIATLLPHAESCRVRLDGIQGGTVFAPRFAHVLVNLVLMAREALHGFGEVILAGDATDIVVTIAGPRAAWPKGMVACLTDEAAAWQALNDPHSLQMPLTVLLARAAALRLTVLLAAGAPSPAPPLRLQEV